ncbi:hypothetical protein [Streptomyces sp. NPDC002209]|uniref:hypothetical protein n=1 Tax=Streptomyces sp. NPDC002209 TaxID=3364638 RepID=UPI0036A0BE00
MRLLAGPADAQAAVRAYPEVTDLLVEEYLEGTELAVAALSRAGRHRILGWTRRIPGPGAAATTAIAAPTARSLARVLDRAAALLGRPVPLTPDSHGIHVPPPPWRHGPDPT